MAIVDADGKQLAASNDVDSQPIAFHSILGYYIGWAADCSFSASGDLRARIAFSQDDVVTMPIVDFRPSCVDGLTNYNGVFMYVDDPQ